MLAYFDRRQVPTPNFLYRAEEVSRSHVYVKQLMLSCLGCGSVTLRCRDTKVHVLTTTICCRTAKMS